MKYFYTFILMFLVLIMAGCTFSSSSDEIDYSLDLSALPDEIYVDNLELSDIKLNIIKQDSTTSVIPLSESMISKTDLEKLQTPGNHEISVTYKNITKTFEIELLEKKFKVIFLNYNGEIYSEQIVSEGKDAILPNYDKVIGYRLTGFSSEDYKNVSKDCIITPIYEEYMLTIEFKVNDEQIELRTVQEGSILSDLPTIPYKEGYIGSWNYQEGLTVMDNMIIEATYELDNSSPLLQETEQYLINKYSNKMISTNIELETSYNGVNISWNTNSEYLSNLGELNRPYKETKIELTYTIEVNNKTVTGNINVTLEGYKDLSQNIASGYIYRNYSKLTDQFFETMDIVYCAFILFNADGTLQNNASVLANIENWVTPKAKEKGVYVVLSLGGGGAEPKAAFVSMTKNAESRKRLIDNIIYLINRYGFDGVDVDWETPTTSQAPYFTTFVKELNEAVKKNNPHHLVTAAITGGRWQPPKYDLKNSGQYLDYINVMTYGMSSNSGYYHNALYTRKGYHNTNLKVGGSLSSCSIDESVTIFNNLGIPNKKLIFGLAFYGIRQFNNEGSWVNNGSVDYTSIKNNYLNDPSYTYYYDETSQVPYLVSNDNLHFISFDDPRSIAAKCNYVKEKNCGGVMYWENGCDTTGDLVQAIYDSLKQ